MGWLVILLMVFYFQNEINEIPFFELDVPREVAIRIFHFLDTVQLCRCSQVSDNVPVYSPKCLYSGILYYFESNAFPLTHKYRCCASSKSSLNNYDVHSVGRIQTFETCC